MSLLPSILDAIARGGPLTVAAFMARALYDPLGGYYTGARRRSGRDGDFYTSVDVGPLFGELLASLFARLCRGMRADGPEGRLMLAEAGAGDGRLMCDVLDALAREAPDCYEGCEVALVERSEAARAAHPTVLGRHADRVRLSGAELPPTLSGILFANELLDAMPFHRLRATGAGWREVYVDAVAGRLVLREGALSDPALARYFDALPVVPEPGRIADVSPAALLWVRGACRAIARGYLLLIDYGHEARELFSARHGEGTLRSYRNHLVDPPPNVSSGSPAWLADPGEGDITGHVDFTSVRQAVEAEGFRVLASCDQTRFLTSLDLADRLSATTNELAALRRRLAAKTLVLPGGLGTTHRALLACKDAPLDLPGLV